MAMGQRSALQGRGAAEQGCRGSRNAGVHVGGGQADRVRSREGISRLHLAGAVKARNEVVDDLQSNSCVFASPAESCLTRLTCRHSEQRSGGVGYLVQRMSSRQRWHTTCMHTRVASACIGKGRGRWPEAAASRASSNQPRTDTANTSHRVSAASAASAGAREDRREEVGEEDGEEVGKKAVASSGGRRCDATGTATLRCQGRNDRHECLLRNCQSNAFGCSKQNLLGS